MFRENYKKFIIVHDIIPMNEIKPEEEYIGEYFSTLKDNTNNKFIKNKKQKYKCIHNTYRYNCRICEPDIAVCSHNKLRRSCYKCTPSRSCEHVRSKSSCKICTPSIACVHGKFKKACKICTPSITCEHNNIKKSCSKCRRNEYKSCPPQSIEWIKIKQYDE